MSIYTTANWSAGTYGIWDIVRYPSNTNMFYYSLVDNNTSTPGDSSWGGISSFNGISKPIFVWRTNYGIVSQHEPKTLSISFADGYEQRIVQNLNNDLLTINTQFDLRTEKETAAIMHFFYQRAAKESFLFTPSPPHDYQKLFVCKKFSESYLFFNNHSISAVLEETPN